MPPTATPAPVPGVGDRVAGQGFALTLHQVLDPAPATWPFAPPAGWRWVALDVTFENTGTAMTSYVFFNAALRTSDGRAYQPTLVGGPQPPLSSSTLPPGQAVRGWITFAIPDSAHPATFAYQGTSGGGSVVFGLGR